MACLLSYFVLAPLKVAKMGHFSKHVINVELIHWLVCVEWQTGKQRGSSLPPAIFYDPISQFSV